MAKKNPDIDYTVEADDTLKNGFVVVWREKIVQPQADTKSSELPAIEDAPAEQVAENQPEISLDWESALQEALNNSTPIVFAGKKGGKASYARPLSPARKNQFKKIIGKMIDAGMPASLVSQIAKVGHYPANKTAVAGITQKSKSFVTYTQFWRGSDVQIRHAIAHELGHFLDIENGNIGKISFTKDFDDAYDELLEWYKNELETGDVNHALDYPFNKIYPVKNEFRRSEAFAQAVGLYFSDHDNLLKNVPSAYRAIELAIDAENQQNGNTGTTTSGAAGANQQSASPLKNNATTGAQGTKPNDGGILGGASKGVALPNTRVGKLGRADVGGVSSEGKGRVKPQKTIQAARIEQWRLLKRESKQALARYQEAFDSGNLKIGASLNESSVTCSVASLPAFANSDR